ncbi:hypothetical protein PybrP1_009825 [[Pythium] brassicae (nom. inval.)]|nr:hypothetical protein PybrP1_009825 [[Pythium] brassicae (nom. inval.)]
MPQELLTSAWPPVHARRSDADTGDAMSRFSTSPVVIAPSTGVATSAPPAAAEFFAASPASSQRGAYAQQHYSHHQPHGRPHHQRKKSVPWIPDSLAERCYGCHASFSLVLRRHHCRRCGNVFCDACSSARIPLLSAGFSTPVRVCEKCCVAAKKAHAKMVEDRMQQQLMLLQNPELESYLPYQASRSNSAGSRYEQAHAVARSGSLPTRRRKQRAMTESVAQASGLFFHPPPIHRSRTVGDSAVAARRLSAQYASTDHLFEDREHDSDDGGADYRMQTLPGEVGLVSSENVRIRFMERVNHVGTLYITNYRIVFSPYVGGAVGDSGSVKSDSGGKPVDARFSADLSVNAKSNVKEDELPYTSDVQSDAVHAYQAINIVSVERLKKKEMAETDSGMLDIVCKDFRHVQFFFSGLVSKQTFSNFDRSFSLIRQYAFGEPSGPQPEFAKLSMEIFDGVPDGWKVYNPVAEFQRMGVSASSKWRVSLSNQKYAVCSTYPSLYVVPATVSDRVLFVAAKFRSKNRIPALSWRDIHTGAVICRSSQPLVGLSQKQCDEDVFLIQAIAAANPSSTKLVIIDARPWKNAVAQKTVGRAGYEMTDHYETRHATASLKYADMMASAAAAAETSAVSSSPGTTASLSSYMNSIGASASASSAFGDEDDSCSDRTQLLEAIESSLVLTECKILFMGIENIHAMRKSYNKLLDSCIGKQSNEKWLDHLDSSHWMEHTSKILESAVEIVRLIKEQKASVLIHCSDGWDRTAQLSSLAQLMMDPYYRTVQGFQVLIEKEWCSFGHKFRDRTGHGLSNASSEISPVFLQWIDCVWQIQTQFPSSFQFNERFLIIILDHLYSCRFGTFLYNSEKARVEEELSRPTVSLWTYMNTLDRAVIENPFYHPHTAPRKKWKASVTATRQCYEIPSKALSECVGSQRGSEQLVYGDKARQREQRRYDAVSLVHTDSSSQMSVSLSSGGYESDNSEAREQVDGQDLDEFIHDMHSELRVRGKHDHVGSKAAVIGAGDFESESESDNEYEDESSDFALNGRSSCFHKIIRDLDSGFSFPQAVEPSELSNFQSSTGMIRSVSAPPTSRASIAAPTSVTESTPPAISATPPTRPSLSMLFTPMGGCASESAEAIWNGTEGDVASESDEQSRLGKMGSFEDVIIPCFAIKALHFWTRYYLRWDSAANFGRDASIEVETLHRDLLMRFESLQKHVGTIRQEEAAKWRRKFQRFQAATASAADGNRGARRSRFADTSGDGEDEMFTFDDAMSFHHPGSPQTEIMGPSHVDVVHLSLDQVLKDGEAKAHCQQQGLSLDEQIALLKQVHHERLEQAELAYQEILRHRVLSYVSWLFLYVCANCIGFASRFACYPQDSAAWWWPAIAKGSAECILINVVLAILFICYHSFHGAACWMGALQAPYWLVLPTIVYARECQQRRRIPSSETRVVRYKIKQDTLILRLTKPASFGPQLLPGMKFVFVQAPSISRVEWHPFSISSAPHDDFLQLHIQQVGFWTHELSVQLRLERSDLKLRVSGPIGSSTSHFGRYEVVVFIAAGIGVTPFLSALRHILHSWRQGLSHPADAPRDRVATKQFCLVWTTRKAHHPEWVLQILDEFQDVLSHPHYRCALEIHIHMTRSQTLGDKYRGGFVERLGVFICASKRLTTLVKDEAAVFNATASRTSAPRLDVFAETF